ncbi:MAG: hypothetical protein IIA45_07960 [Bacteroidetes bacterium]|nr:hypothetical protein [Bacteroidota bacterium]
MRDLALLKINDNKSLILVANNNDKIQVFEVGTENSEQGNESLAQK